MKDDFELKRLEGTVAKPILNAARIASERLTEARIPHALCGGLAVCIHGYQRTTDDVDFLVGDEAFEQHGGGVVTLKLSLISIGGVKIDFVSMDKSLEEKVLVVRELQQCNGDVVSLPMLILMKLMAARQRDLADVIELIKRGGMDIDHVNLYLKAIASKAVETRWERLKQQATEER